VKAYKNLLEIQTDILQNKITMGGLVLYYLDTIEKHKQLNVFLEVFANEAIEKAEEIQRKLQTGRHGKLAGMVVALKDNISYKGHTLSASSKMLKDFKAIYNATVVDKLLAEDAIIIGRLNCDEFAMGASNENSAFGPVLNGADPTRVPGGSSGGAAVAAQMNMCLATIASDTGGSIRQPAALCGVYGIKPTYGRVSRYGVIAYASSFDQIRPITQSIEDMQLIMQVISGIDAKDATTSPVSVEDYTHKAIDKGPQKIAVIKETIEHEGVDLLVKEQTLKAIKNLEAKGHEVTYINFDLLDYLVPTYYVLTTAEASSNLSRFSGVVYGHRSPLSKDYDSTVKLSRTEGFGKEVKRRIMLGTFVLSSGYFDAYYTQAQKVRQLVKIRTEEILKSYDYILSPTSPTPAFKLGEKADNPIAMYLADIFTVHANIAGIPAISIPNGETPEGLPIGLQLMGRKFDESGLMQLAKEL
jgi:aspartyl-tRNA(Asn)/glutamyl-tRNA(Gln) amidotransferase subunit A